MFDKQHFSNILKKIIGKYNTITEFADISGAGRSYISKYINQKIDAPPTPKVLQKIADNSRGLTTYTELMIVCGYIDEKYSNISDNELKEALDENNEYNKTKNTLLEALKNLLPSLYKLSLSELSKKGLIDLKQFFYISDNQVSNICSLNTEQLVREEEFKFSDINEISLLAQDLTEDDLNRIDSILHTYPTKKRNKFIEMCVYQKVLFNFDNKPAEVIKIPVLGKIPAGIPIEAVEDIIEYAEIPEEWLKGRQGILWT